MTVREVLPDIYWIGAIDWNRRLFDSLIPLPDGTSYNAYLVKGSEKTALIDTVDPAKEFEYVCNLIKLGVEKIDYIIVNHAEQDHSGSLPMAAELFPGATVVTSEKCKDLVVHLLDIPPERCLVVKDRDTISLGNKTLEFIMAPWVHWPETMMTYVREDNVLFSCDLFGSHLATSDLFARDPARGLSSGETVLCRDHDAVPVADTGAYEKDLGTRDPDHRTKPWPPAPSSRSNPPGLCRMDLR